jgi:hypothetical protein
MWAIVECGPLQSRMMIKGAAPQGAPQHTPVASGSTMSCPSPKHVIVVNWAPGPSARACESLPFERDYRSVKRPDKSLSGVTLCDLIEREG